MEGIIDDATPGPEQRHKIPSSAAAMDPECDTLAGWIDRTATGCRNDKAAQEHDGFAWSLYHHTLQLFALLLPTTLEYVAISSLSYHKQGQKSLKNSLGRLFLWGASFEGGKLESVLDESESLKLTVMESLTALGNILLFSMLSNFISASHTDKFLKRYLPIAWQSLTHQMTRGSSKRCTT